MTLRWTPRARYERPDSLEFRGLSIECFEVAFGPLRFACRFEEKDGAGVLFVCLRHQRGPHLEPLPVFHSEYSASEFGGHILGVCDPSLFLNPALEVGCFFGTRECDAVEGLVRIAQKTAASYRIDPSRIIYWASSGAALGAAMAAIKSGSVAVLVNPQLDDRLGNSRFALEVARTFGVSSGNDITRDFPLRSRVPDALDAARALGIQSKLLIVQNELDRPYYKRHFEPFCRRFSVPLNGGFDPTGTILTMVYSDPSGHDLEPPAVRARILREGLPALLGGSLSAPRPPRVFDVTIDRIGRHVVGLPAGVSFLRLLSEPHVLPGEARMLGAAIGAISIDGRDIPLSDPSLVDGFYQDEGAHRWTDGKGIVPILVRNAGSVASIEVLAIARAV
jgi:hypothetical protein